MRGTRGDAKKKVTRVKAKQRKNARTAQNKGGRLHKKKIQANNLICLNLVARTVQGGGRERPNDDKNGGNIEHRILINAGTQKGCSQQKGR